MLTKVLNTLNKRTERLYQEEEILATKYIYMGQLGYYAENMWRLVVMGDSYMASL